MLLPGKVALVFGAGGAVGGAVSKAFAREGAHVVLGGRHIDPLGAVLAAIQALGGSAEIAIVDALAADEVDALLRRVRAQHGRVDVSFNLVGLEDAQGPALLDMPLVDVIHPVDRAVRSHLITASAAARQMEDGGVILALIANCGRRPVAGVGGFGIACAATAALCRQLAIELGPRGIRVGCLMSAGSPDAPGVAEVFELHAANAGVGRAEFVRRAGAGTMLGHLPSLSEVADAAVLLASDHARAMTGVVMNVTCGEIAD